MKVSTAGLTSLWLFTYVHKHRTGKYHGLHRSWHWIASRVNRRTGGMWTAQSIKTFYQRVHGDI